MSESRETELIKAIIYNLDDSETEYTKTPQSRNEEILVSILNETEYTKTPQSREEELLLELKEKIGGLVPPVPPVIKRVTGNPIEFSDGADAPLVKCVTEIVGSQDLHGYDKPWVGGAGKNKCESFFANSSRTTYVAVLYCEFDIQPSTQYTISFVGTAGNVLYTNEDVVANAEYKEVLSGVTYFTFTTKATIPSSSYVSDKGWIILKNGASQPNDNAFSNVQIELGSTATTYSPYSNICPITAYTENTISVGAELLSYVAQSKYVVGVSGNLKTDGELELTGTGSSNNIIVWNMWDSTADINRQSNNKKNLTNGAYEITGCVDDKVGLQVYGSNTLNAGNNDSVLIFAGNGTFTIDDTYAYNWVRIMFYGGVAFDHTKFNFKIRKIEPHTTTYPSAIYRGSEDVVKGTETHDKVKIVFDGSVDESWNYEVSSQGGNFYINIDDAIAGQYAGTGLISNIYEASSGLMLQKDKILISNGKNLNCPMGDTLDIHTVADWKTWLSTHNLEVVYDIAPSTSSVTPTNLPIKSLSGYNHIESTTGDMQVDYITDAYQNFVDTVESALPNTRKSGTKAMDIFLSLDNPKIPDQKEVDEIQNGVKEEIMDDRR